MEDNVDPRWRKSSYSGNGGGDCVEVAGQASRVLVRDTKQDGAGPALRFTPAAWRRFADQVKRSLASDSPPSTTAAARDLVRCGHVMRSRRVLPCGPWPAGVHVVSLAE